MRRFGLIGLLLLSGCGSERVEPIAVWHLDDGAGVELPAQIDAHGPRFALSRRLLVPPDMRGRTLSLVIPQIEGRTRLYVSSVLVEPLDDPGSGWRGERAPRWRIPESLIEAGAEGPVLPLRLEVENAAPQSSKLPSRPRLSATPWGDARFLAARAINHTGSAISFGALLGMFGTYATLWALDRSRRAYGHLAFAALCALISPLFWLGVTQHVFGTLELDVVAVALALAGFSVLEFTHHHYELPKPSRRWWQLGGALVLATAVAGFVPALVRPLGSISLVANYAVMLSVAWVLVKMMRRQPRPRDVGIMSVAWIVLFLGTVPSALWRFGFANPLEGVVLTPIGMTVFLLLHGTTLSRAHVESMHTTDELNVELAARIEQVEAKNREVSVLNVELRRQIADRSQKLAEALARIEGVTSASRGLREGEVLSERYRVVRPLGSGGMGAVYEVVRLTDDKAFALKVLRGETSGHLLSRFAREAEIAARIHHPNLVSVVDVDVAESGSLYIVMELVDGGSLESMSFGAPAKMLPLLGQVGSGLAALHAAHVIHRDLKPGNVLVDALGVAKISDFGISALREVVDPLAATRTPDESKSPALTQTGAMLGTPLYMAPELFRGADRANEATDVFALGLLAYVVLSGRYPYDGPPMHTVGAGRPLPVPPRLDGVPEPVATIVARCLSVEPGERPTAAEFAAAFGQPVGPPP